MVPLGEVVGIAVLTMAIGIGLAAGQDRISGEQIATAIAAGCRGEDLSVRVGSVTYRSGACTVVVDGPLSRIAAAAREASAGYRPFTADNVTPAMRAENYEVSLRTSGTAACSSRHIVLQPVGAQGRTLAALPPQLKRHDLLGLARDGSISCSEMECELLQRLTREMGGSVCCPGEGDRALEPRDSP